MYPHVHDRFAWETRSCPSESAVVRITKECEDNLDWQ